MYISRRQLTLAPGIWSRVVRVGTFDFDQLNFFFLYDQRLEEKGIVVDSGGILIDQGKTAIWLNDRSADGQLIPAGRLPEEFLEELRDGTSEMSLRERTTIIPTVSHFGWQLGCLAISGGRFIQLPADPVLFEEGVVEMFLYSKSTGWWPSEVPLTKPDMALEVDFGFEATMIVRQREIVPLEELVETPRLRADARNLFDFAGGKTIANSSDRNSFFQMIRPLLPTEADDLRALLKGEVVRVERPQPLSWSDYTWLSAIVVDHNLDHLQLSSHPDGRMQLTVTKPLPRMRMPLTGFGLDQHSQFMAVTIDGRQEGSAGATIEELAQVMLDEGAMFASLGGGGGDTYVGQIQAGSLININVPSNVDQKTQLPGARRRSPNALVIVPA